mgnify:CR=1 FL=1
MGNSYIGISANEKKDVVDLLRHLSLKKTKNVDKIYQQERKNKYRSCSYKKIKL